MKARASSDLCQRAYKRRVTNSSQGQPRTTNDVADHVEHSKARKTLLETPTKRLPGCDRGAAHARMILNGGSKDRSRVCEFEGPYVRIRTRGADRDTPDRGDAADSVNHSEQGYKNNVSETLSQRATHTCAESARLPEVDHEDGRLGARSELQEGVREADLRGGSAIIPARLFQKYS